METHKQLTDRLREVMMDEIENIDRHIGYDQAELNMDEIWSLKASVARLSVFLHMLSESEADRVLMSSDYYCMIEDWLDDLDEECSLGN